MRKRRRCATFWAWYVDGLVANVRLEHCADTRQRRFGVAYASGYLSGGERVGGEALHFQNVCNRVLFFGVAHFGRLSSLVASMMSPTRTVSQHAAVIVTLPNR